MALTFSLTQMFLDQLKEFILLCQTSPEVLQRDELAFFLDFCSSWSQIQKFRQDTKVNSDSAKSLVNVNVFPKQEDKKSSGQDVNNEEFVKLIQNECNKQSSRLLDVFLERRKDCLTEKYDYLLNNLR